MHAFQPVKIDVVFELINCTIVSELQDITWLQTSTKSPDSTSTPQISRWNQTQKATPEISPSRAVLNAFSANQTNTQQNTTTRKHVTKRVKTTSN